MVWVGALSCTKKNSCDENMHPASFDRFALTIDSELICRKPSSSSSSVAQIFYSRFQTVEKLSFILIFNFRKSSFLREKSLL
ncbi:hypothetical protein PGB90_009461 [Kerria lacca]